MPRSLFRTKNLIILCFFLSCRLAAKTLPVVPDTIDYEINNYVFDGATTHYVNGFVCFENGFTVMPNDATNAAGLIFDGCIPVAGGIDLRETSTLNLQRDIEFDSSVTLSSSGVIWGNNKAIVLHGDLEIPAGKVLHIGSNTIFEGNGNSLIVNDNAQIFVDTNITLTLRNLTLRNKQHTLTFPPVRLAAFGSQLWLDNTIINPQGDFLFPQGQLFILNDVLFTGTSAFIYQSTQPCRIAQNSRLSFDDGTTFSVAPATYTDIPFDQGSITSNNFIKMADKSSVLYLNGCSLKTTTTGCRFTKGTVALENKVNFLAANALVLTTIETGPSQSFGNPIPALSWSPDGRYVVETYTSPSTISVCQFTGNSLTLVGNQPDSGEEIFAFSWSPDGRYVAVAGAHSAQIYQFSGNGFVDNNGNLSDDPIATPPLYGDIINAVSWSPDGRYLAVGGGSNNISSNLVVYQFSGTNLNLVAISPAYGNRINAVSWSPDGRYFAVGGDANNLTIYPIIYAADPTPQALSNSIVFGNSAKGPDYDVNVNVQCGAKINVLGNISYDGVA